jgi:hypothetical protein
MDVRPEVRYASDERKKMGKMVLIKFLGQKKPPERGGT